MHRRRPARQSCQSKRIVGEGCNIYVGTRFEIHINSSDWSKQLSLFSTALTHRPAQVVISSTRRSSARRAEVWSGCLKVSRPWLVLAHADTLKVGHPLWMAVGLDDTWWMCTFRTLRVSRNQWCPSWKSRNSSALCELPVWDRRRRRACWDPNYFSRHKSRVSFPWLNLRKDE